MDVLDEKLVELEGVLEYEFLNLALLQKALTHSSCKNDVLYSNERLEFLGDAVLGLVITQYLFESFPDQPEGELTRIKSMVVSRSSLGRVGKRLRLDEFLILGKGLARRKTLPKSLLANAYEAVLAAIYLDGGYDEAREFTLRSLADQVEIALAETHSFNYKSLLQQYAQRELGVTPTYRLAGERGPDHGKSFVIVAVLGGEDHGQGAGACKKEAEQRAAQDTLRMLNVDFHSGKKRAHA